jgi:hypothetical protein
MACSRRYDTLGHALYLYLPRYARTIPESLVSRPGLSSLQLVPARGMVLQTRRRRGRTPAQPHGATRKTTDTDALTRAPSPEVMPSGPGLDFRRIGVITRIHECATMATCANAIDNKIADSA